MQSLRKLRARHNGFLRIAAAVTLFLMIALGLIVAARPRSHAAARQTPAHPQAAFFAYWSETHGFKSTAALNNAGDAALTVTPTLYNLSGQSLTVNPITLAPRQQLAFDIADWLAQGKVGDEFKSGNLILTYESSDAAYLGALVTVTNPTASLSFDFRDEMPMSFESSRLEGMWWRPDAASQYDLVLSNMESAEVSVTLKASGGPGLSINSEFTVRLGPHQTEVINLNERSLPATASPQAGKLGGLSLTHTGAPGAVLAYGLLSNAATGFSSRFVFEDPATSQSQQLAAAHLFIGKPDVPGLPEQATFTSIGLLRNAADVAIDVKPAVSFLASGQPRTIRLASRHLLPHQLAAIDIGAELQRTIDLGGITGVGLTLTSTGAPGALVAQLTSYDQTRNYTFDVPLKDPAVSMNRMTGSYPWTIAGDRQSIIHVRNTTDQPSRFTIQLDFEGGSYALPIQELAAQQEVAIDVRQLRDRQTPDSIGRVIPLAVSSGQTNWAEHGPEALIGRTEVYSPGGAVASSFSCPGPCCIPSTVSVDMNPTSMDGPVGDSGLTLLYELRERDCDGAQFGPFNVTTSATWSSTNTNVATVGTVTSSGCQVNCVGAGTATLHAAFSGLVYIRDPETNHCTPELEPFPGDGPIVVRPHLSSLSLTRGVQGIEYGLTITGTGFKSPASVNVAGTGITVSGVQVGSSTQILATFTLADNATGGNHAVTVSVSSQTSDNSINFFVQIPTTIQQDSIDAITTCDPTHCTIGSVSNACGAFRLVHYTLLDQDNPKQPVVEPATVTETVVDLAHPNDPPTIKPIPTNQDGAFDDLLALFKVTTCPSLGESASVRQTFTATIGNKTFPLTRTNRIDYMKSGSGVYSIVITVEAQ